MLSTLRIRNLAIVSDLELELRPGLNIVTGETGAGKSILLRGLELLAGAKGATDLIRHSMERCEVEGLFVLPERARSGLREEFEWAAEVLADDEAVVRRIVDRSGRGKISINGRLISRGELENISRYLFDITGQHSQQRLFASENHRKIVDTFGVSDDLVEAVREGYRSYSEAERRLREFQSAKEAKSDYFRRIAFEWDELAAAKLRTGERAEITERLSRLANVESLVALSSEVIATIEEEESGPLRTIHRIAGRLERGLKLDPSLAESLDLVRSAAVQLEEGKRMLLDYGSSLEADPAELEMLRERVAEIARLMRKYGKDEGEIVQYFAKIASELSAYESGEFDEERLLQRVKAERVQLDGIERRLTTARREAAARLEVAVNRDLVQLGMPKARFVVSVTDVPSSAAGADRIELQLAANPGEPPRGIDKVASGGELSRILLVLKTLLNERMSPSTQVFDEIDTGIGGAVAQTVGEKIKSLTERYQVILVTHAPQIAALADAHFVIRKESTDAETKVSVRELDSDARVHELARMMAGKKVTAKFEASARELLKQSL